MSEIRFTHECWLPYPTVEIITQPNGSGMLVIDTESDDEIEFFSLPRTERKAILDKVADWILHYRIMEHHPAAFEANYAEWITGGSN